MEDDVLERVKRAFEAPDALRFPMGVQFHEHVVLRVIVIGSQIP